MTSLKMKGFSNLFLTSSLCTLVTSAAVPVRLMALNSTMTIESMQRTCDYTDTLCHWSFVIAVDGARTECAYDITMSGTTGARYSANAGVQCGCFTVTSNWSGQFGPNDGFITLSIVDYPQGTIAWPAYRDDQLDSGHAVAPDQSYPVQIIP